MVYYKKDRLYLNRLQLEKLVKKYGSPVYVYDLDGILQRLEEFQVAFENNVHVHYALKANSNPVILKAFKKAGIGIDTVSWGEVLLALKAGFKPNEIIFSGVGKSTEEIKAAVKRGLYQINIESPQELERVGKTAKKYKKIARVAFRINPDVNPQTHPYITTGFRENKFGMDTSFLPELKNILKKYPRNLELQGLTLHIGSQLLEHKSICEAIEKTIHIYKNFLNEGYPMKTFDVGGGIGIPYDGGVATSLKEYGSAVMKLLKPLGCTILSEPGRILVGPFGVLLTEVEYIKRSPSQNFAIVNTGMHHLIRPALYGAQHRIWPLKRRHEAEKYSYDVVGPICESSDFLGKHIEVHGLAQGDLLAILDAGAYGYSMANFYNARKLPKEIVIANGKAAVSPVSSVFKYSLP